MKKQRGKMTTVSQLITYLQELPPDTEVSVIEGYDCGYAYCTKEVDLDLDPYNGNVDFTDFTGNQFAKEGSEHFNKKYLTLGIK